MNLRELRNAVALLDANPLTSDSTPVTFENEAVRDDGDVFTETHEPVAVHVESSPRRIVFTDRATHLDVAR